MVVALDADSLLLLLFQGFLEMADFVAQLLNALVAVPAEGLDRDQFAFVLFAFLEEIFNGFVGAEHFVSESFFLILGFS